MKYFWSKLCILSGALVSFTLLAQTNVYVQNNTNSALEVIDIVVTGDAISKKAWKTGVQEIPAGDREKVLTLNRAGKVNWMDPTPRYIEPGKTAMFSTNIVTAGSTQDTAIVLKQTLTGTGASSKMQHSLDNVDPKQAWTIDHETRQADWSPVAADQITVTYRAYKDSGKTHLEYVFASE